MKRGDLVTIAVAGDYGKPRPALVIQSDIFQNLNSLTVLRLTSTWEDAAAFRVEVHPSASTALRMVSYVMIDRAVTLPRDKVGPVFGRLDDATMRAISRAMAVFLDLDG